MSDQSGVGRAAPAVAPNATAQKPLYKRLYTQLSTAHFRSEGHGEQGSPGTYEVAIVFRHPVQPAGIDDTLRRADEIDGDSGIGIPGEIQSVITTADKPPREIRIRLQPNANGRVAKAISTLEATNYGDARSTVYSHLGALLSRLAFEADAAIDVFQVDVTAQDGSGQDRGVVMRGQTRRFVGLPEIRVAPPFYRAAFGIYREGLNATNPFYALLCFHRVAEGAIGTSSRQSAYAKANGLDPTRESPVVENVDDIAKDFPDLIGWRCTRAADWLNANYRVPVAHGLQETLHAPDEMFERDRYWRAVPLARQVAHKLLAVEWALRERLGLQTIAELDT